MLNLLSQFAELLDLIPAGLDGFDGSIVWPLLIAGAQSTLEPAFRCKFSERILALGESADYGSFGRMVRLLQELWSINDALDKREKIEKVESGAEGGAETNVVQSVHWRDVMLSKGWDFLFI